MSIPHYTVLAVAMVTLLLSTTMSAPIDSTCRRKTSEELRLQLQEECCNNSDVKDLGFISYQMGHLIFHNVGVILDNIAIFKDNRSSSCNITVDYQQNRFPHYLLRATNKGCEDTFLTDRNFKVNVLEKVGCVGGEEVWDTKEIMVEQIAYL